ncbi:MAG: choice-of-anchor J domain-containing protein [Muribaculaceae bacterium]|nr:choice-of-anchor J domain-containing protein [Muribaculaceae bacterium]
MKKLFYSLVLCVIAAIPAFAQETVTVYDGDATNAYVPVYGFYADAFNKCEYIMPADDLSELTGSTITKMVWYMTTPPEAVWGGNFQVYLKEVEENVASTSFYGTDGATLVFEGPLDGTSGTLEIEFANDFAYEGGNLLVCVYQVEKGTYKSATFAGAAATGAAVSNYNYSSLEAITSGTIRDFLPKTTFEFVPSSGVVYYKPKNVQVTPGVNDAVVTWDAGADETSWAVEYKKAADEEWTSAGTVTEKTITLDALENGTQYDVRVKSIYADGESGWTVASFATLACEASDMGEVEYILTDSYGDGWNNNHLQIFLHGTNVMVADLFIPGGVNGTPNDNLLEGIVNLCYGVEYDLVWVAGSYSYETGFTLTAPSGEVIYEFQGTGSSSGPTPTPGVLTTFTIQQVTCPRPTGVVVENITYNSAVVSWVPGAEEQDLFQVIYAKGDVAAADITMEPVQANDPFVTLTGLEENSHYSVYVRSVCSEEDMSIWTKVVTFDTPLRFPLPENLYVNEITKNSAVANWTGDAPAYNFRYRPKTGLNEGFEYGDGELPAGWIPAGLTNLDADGNGLSWQVLKITDWNMGGTPLVAAAGDYCIVSESVSIEGGTAVTGDNWLISSKVALDGTLEVSAADLGDAYAESFTVMVSTTGNAPEDFVALETVNTPGALNTWQKYEFDLSAFEGQEGYVAIRHQPNGTSGYILMIDEFKIVSEAAGAEWIYVNNTTSPVTMEGLTAGTTYECQVQGAYEDGNSLWTDLVYFTTTSADAMPASVTVENITATSGDVNVVGSQDRYNIRYRTAAIQNGVVEDFMGYETGDCPTGWTLIDADGDGQNWYVWNLQLEDGTTQTTFSSNSYINNYGALTPDNWAITPQSTLGTTVQFDAWGQDPSYAGEHFQVYVSTTGTEIADFTPISEEIVATGVQTTYTFDLGPYAGEQGYIAIRHFNVTDMYVLNVTNFYMAGETPDVPAGEWTVVENVEVPYTIEGLAPETKYEVQVQGIYEAKATTDWTQSVFFTTLANDGMNEFYVVGSFNGWNQTEEGGRIELVENEDGTEYTGQVTLDADAEFKIITPAEDGGWIWYGGEDANGVGYFEVNEAMLGIDIALMDGSNFKVVDAGDYTITVKAARAINEPLVMVITKTPNAISTIAVDSQSNEWYNLNGQKLNGKPVTPGIYINGGKKVIVR